MKKALNLTLSMLAMLALAACGSDSEETDEDATDSTQVENVVPPADDMTMDSDTADMNAMEGEDMVDGE